jgi:hypothetical protein
LADLEAAVVVLAAVAPEAAGRFPKFLKRGFLEWKPEEKQTV